MKLAGLGSIPVPDPELFVDPEPLPDPEPLDEPEPLPDPEPLDEPEPLPDPEPLVEPEPLPLPDPPGESAGVNPEPEPLPISEPEVVSASPADSEILATPSSGAALVEMPEIEVSPPSAILRNFESESAGEDVATEGDMLIGRISKELDGFIDARC